MKEKIIIAFGANLGDRRATAEAAIAAVDKNIGTIVRASTPIESEALLLPEQEAGSQPPYLNAVWIAETVCTPDECLTRLLGIEQSLGRIRAERWGARTIDLDLIAYGDRVISSASLTLPHPEMHKRDFVLGPLCEIDPEWVHPVIQKNARNLLAALG